MKNRNTFESINIIKYPRIPKFQDSYIVAEKKRLDVTVYHLRSTSEMTNKKTLASAISHCESRNRENPLTHI